jgi:hypothetical protein
MVYKNYKNTKKNYNMKQSTVLAQKRIHKTAIWLKMSCVQIWNQHIRINFRSYFYVTVSLLADKILLTYRTSYDRNFLTYSVQCSWSPAEHYKQVSLQSMLQMWTDIKSQHTEKSLTYCSSPLEIPDLGKWLDLISKETIQRYRSDMQNTGFQNMSSSCGNAG